MREVSSHFNKSQLDVTILGTQRPKESWRILCCESAQAPFFRASLLLDECDVVLPPHFLAPQSA